MADEFQRARVERRIVARLIEAAADEQNHLGAVEGDATGAGSGARDVSAEHAPGEHGGSRVC